MSLFPELKTAISQLLAMNDFWLLATATERGIEEGTRNARYRESVAHFIAAGCNPTLAKLLHLGINGNLAQCVREDSPRLEVSMNPSRGRDLVIRSPDGRAHAAVEIKHVYDMTFDKYFVDVAADREKLLQYRAQHHDSELYQVVFFVEFPNAAYPPGQWYGKIAGKQRREYLVYPTIESQYAHVIRALGATSSWPTGKIKVRQLTWPPSDAVVCVVEEWFRRIFQPASAWSFDGAIHYREAAVGAAVWQY